MIFNQSICDSKVSHHSVTREVYFIRGSGQIYDVEKRLFELKNIVVADTIGLCDTEWDDAKIINLIKGRVSNNFRFIDKVFIVFRADRLSKQHVLNIKNILEWVNYQKNQLRVTMVSTYADYLSTEKKEERYLECLNIPPKYRWQQMRSLTHLYMQGFLLKKH